MRANMEFVKDTNKSLLQDVLFYFVGALLLGAILCYGIFVLKTYLLEEKISQFNSQIAAYGTMEQKASEKQVLDYKKKIDDFSSILATHKISSNIFTFLETITVANVWFSNFDMAQSTNEMRLAGEAETMEALSRQVELFEASKGRIASITVLSSQVAPNGKVKFILNLVLDPAIFTYLAPAPAPAAPTANP